MTIIVILCNTKLFQVEVKMSFYKPSIFIVETILFLDMQELTIVSDKTV